VLAGPTDGHGHGHGHSVLINVVRGFFSKLLQCMPVSRCWKFPQPATVTGYLFGIFGSLLFEQRILQENEQKSQHHTAIQRRLSEAPLVCVPRLVSLFFPVITFGLLIL
jgi:hypothetical protein